METKQPTRAKKAELDPKEWDFRSIPKSEIEACFIYEYARELARRSPRILGLFAKCRAGSRGKKRTPQFPEECKAYLEFRKIMTACFPDFPTIHEDWFPDTAWQELDEKLRSRLVKDVNNGTEHLWNSSPIHKLSIEMMKFEKKVGANGTWRYAPEPFRKEDISQTERGFIAINWNYPDPQIKRAFAEWLSEQRNYREKCGLGGEIKYKPKGRGGFWDRLNWLGALRQKGYYPKKQLIDGADAQGDKLKRGASFYSQFRDLREAAKKARQLLDGLLSQMGRI